MSAAQRTKPRPAEAPGYRAVASTAGLRRGQSYGRCRPALSLGLSKGEFEASMVSGPSSATRCGSLHKAPPNLSESQFAPYEHGEKPVLAS